MLIGLLGRKRTGKDTVADYLVNYYNYSKYTMAKPLKDACQKMFGFTNEQLYGNDKEKIDKYWGISPRQALIYVGTDLVRNQMNTIMPHIGNNFWIKSLERKLIGNKNNIVISDVRFDNEAKFIRNNGGIIIKLNRFDPEPISAEDSIDAIKGDYELDNNGTIELIYEQIDKIIKSY